jgi:hypothetical protein
VSRASRDGFPAEVVRTIARAARLLGPRPADLGSSLASTVDVAFVVGLTCNAPADAPLVRGSLDALPFLSGSLTGVLVGDAPPTDAAAREMARVLQPGGVAVVASAAKTWDASLARAAFAVARDGGVVVAKKAGGAEVEIPKTGVLSMFVPRRWLEKRPPR